MPVGPLSVRVKLPEGVRGNQVRLLVSERPTRGKTNNREAHFGLSTILDHEVVVIS